MFYSTVTVVWKLLEHENGTNWQSVIFQMFGIKISLKTLPGQKYLRDKKLW